MMSDLSRRASRGGKNNDHLISQRVRLAFFFARKEPRNIYGKSLATYFLSVESLKAHQIFFNELSSRPFFSLRHFSPCPIDWNDERNRFLLQNRWVHNLMKLIKEKSDFATTSRGGGGKCSRFTRIKLFGFTKNLFSSSPSKPTFCTARSKAKTRERRKPNND